MQGLQRIIKVDLVFPSGFPLLAEDLVRKLLKLEPVDRIPLKDSRVMCETRSQCNFWHTHRQPLTRTRIHSHTQPPTSIENHRQASRSTDNHAHHIPHTSTVAVSSKATLSHARMHGGMLTHLFDWCYIVQGCSHTCARNRVRGGNHPLARPPGTGARKLTVINWWRELACKPPPTSGALAVTTVASVSSWWAILLTSWSTKPLSAGT